MTGRAYAVTVAIPSPTLAAAVDPPASPGPSLGDLKPLGAPADWPSSDPPNPNLTDDFEMVQNFTVSQPNPTSSPAATTAPPSASAPGSTHTASQPSGEELELIDDGDDNLVVVIKHSRRPAKGSSKSRTVALNPWTADEYTSLLNHIVQAGSNASLADAVPGRSSKECRRVWKRIWPDVVKPASCAALIEEAGRG